MKTTKKHTNLLQNLVLAIFVASFSFVGMTAFAQNYQLSQVIDSGVVDMCPNIAGVQSSIPAGMLIDSNGDCYTPSTPPEPITPEPVDLCLNLTGIQTTLPSGYYRTASGLCYLQPAEPTPPNDVCRNLDGIQDSVPAEHYLDESNNCMPAPVPVDMCQNIPGIQKTVPEDMQAKNGVCSTPASVTNPDITDPATTLGREEQLKNVPGMLQPIAQALVDALPEQTVEYFKSLPDGTVQKIPVYVFVLVLILIIIPLLLSIREVIYARQIAAILKRERSIAEQKDNFVALASHYLRTPLTVMRNGLEMMLSIKEVTVEQTEELSQTLTSLDGDISAVLNNLENNSELKDIAAPPDTEKSPTVFGSMYFWIPIVASIILTVIANFFFGVVGDKEIGTSNTLFQVMVVAVFIVAVYVLVRNIHIQKHVKQRSQQLIDHEKTVDETRNSLIENQTSILKTHLDQINRQRTPIETAPSYHIFEDGYMRFVRMLEKFLLLGQIQAGTQRTVTQFNMRDAVDQVLFSYQSDILAKDIRVVNAITNTTVSQNEILFNFVISSLIDNAIKFNKEGGTITLANNPKGRTISINISDDGIGIDNNKLDQLFKPFSRADSAVEFNYEGLGFSLFLNRLIMEYTGGSIAALAEPSGGTRMVVNTPVRVNL